MPNTDERQRSCPSTAVRLATDQRRAGQRGARWRDGHTPRSPAVFLKAGPHWLLALGGFWLAGRVGPRTSRPTRGLQERQRLRSGCGGRPRAGSRDFSLRSPEREGSLRPITGRPVIGSRALWSSGTRAHDLVALRLRGAQLVLEARALDIRSYVPPSREPWPAARGFAAAPHGFAAPALGWARAPQRRRAGGVARARPRRRAVAGRPPADERPMVSSERS
jgi:hypothetical protein